MAREGIRAVVTAFKAGESSSAEPFELENYSFLDSSILSKFQESQHIKYPEKLIINRDMVYSIESIYFMLLKQIPSSMTFKVGKKKIDEVLTFLLENNFNLFTCLSDSRYNSNETLSFVRLVDEVFIQLTVSTERSYDADDNKTFAVSIFYNVNSGIRDTLIKFRKTFELQKDQNHNIHLFQKNEFGEMMLQPYTINGFDLDIDENYDEHFKGVHEKIVDWAQDFSLQNNRITLLHGEPGSGKTNYIKYLLNQLPSVRKIYIPPCYVEALSDPAFLGFIKNYSNSLLLIEDAEKVLISREQDETNSAMSIILNLSDGIMGSVLNFKMIATFNTSEDKIDKALKRKGRMFIKHFFGELSKEKTKALYHKLYGIDPPEDRMVLASIYNPEDNGGTPKPRKSVGFGTN